MGRREAPEFIRWAFYSSWFNYGFEALCVNEFEAKEYGHHVLDRMVSEHVLGTFRCYSRDFAEIILYSFPLCCRTWRTLTNGSIFTLCWACL